MSPLQTSRNDFAGELYITGGSCDWCDALLPEPGVFIVTKFDPSGEQFEQDVLCSGCHRYGAPQSSRREHIELAWKIRPQMSRLERLGWWLIRRANR